MCLHANMAQSSNGRKKKNKRRDGETIDQIYIKLRGWLNSVISTAGREPISGRLLKDRKGEMSNRPAA